MTLIDAQGFDHLAGNEWWDTVAGQDAIETTVVRSGTRSYRVRSGGSGSFGTGYAIKNLPGSYSTIIVGLAFYYDGVYGIAATAIMSLWEGTTNHLEVRLDANRKPYVTRNGTTLGSVAADAIPNNAWCYVEFKATIHDSTGSFELRVDGVNVVSASGVDTRNGGTGVINRLRIGYDDSGSRYVDDIYICDTAGSVNNDFLGDVKVATLYPSGAGNSAQFTPSAGANYAAVDETPYNSDTDYVGSSTVNHVDTYAYGDLPGSAVTIHAVIPTVIARKDEAGPRSIALVARPGVVDNAGSNKALSTNYLAHSQIWETNPDTSAAWTPSQVNASEFGVKVTV